MASCPNHPVEHQLTLGPGLADEGAVGAVGSFYTDLVGSHLHRAVTESQTDLRHPVTWEGLESHSEKSTPSPKARAIFKGKINPGEVSFLPVLHH